MLLTSSPVQFCSTVMGRSLLEWYMQFEDYCCFLGAYKLLLPDEWREENVRVRQTLAEIDYPLLSHRDRIPRLLDDVWAQFLALIPKVSNVLYQIPNMKKMERQERILTALQLDVELQEYVAETQQFLNLPHVVEALQPGSPTPLYGLRHAKCCPPLPFVPHVMQYPPAGLFRIMMYGFKSYVQAVLYPPIQETLGDQAKQLGFEPADICSIEVCKTFAGLEDSYLGENPETFLPAFAPFVLSTATCPPGLRLWLWHKLLHFEKIGHLTFDPVTSNLAKLWDMPEIIMERKPPEEDSSPQIFRRLSGDDIEATIKEVNLEETEMISTESDESLEPITRGRGLYGLWDDS